MQDGSPVWFGCDVGKYSCGENGVMDLDLYQTEELTRTETQIAGVSRTVGEKNPVRKATTS